MKFHSPVLSCYQVMLLFPLLMNIIQFWLVDGFIKASPFLVNKDDDNDDHQESVAADSNAALLDNESATDTLQE